MTKILSNKSNIDLDYPICRPSLDLDFTQEVLDPRITFSRGTVGTRVNRNRLIETVSANQPRFDYDPVTGECKGLLIEESRVNSWLYSGQNVVTGWSPNGVTLSFDNTATAPDGTTNTIKCVETNTFIQKYPNGWWRFGITLTATATTTGTFSIRFTNSISSSANGLGGPYGNYTGDGSSSLYFYGPQVENGAFMTSFIPTTASTVTRSADLAQMTGTNFSSWYNQSEGTVFTSFLCKNWTNNDNLFNKVFTIYENLGGGSETNGFWIGNDGSALNTVRYRVRSGGRNQFGPANLTRTSNDIKVAISVKTNSFAITTQGNKPSTSISGTLPSQKTKRQPTSIFNSIIRCLYSHSSSNHKTQIFQMFVQVWI